MPTIAQGIQKQTIFKVQAGLGTLATGAGGQIIRRKSSVFSLVKDTFEQDEIVSWQQSTGITHGVRRVQGKWGCLLSPGTFPRIIEALVRKDFVAGATTGALTTVTSAVTSGASGTYTRSAGSYLTDGFKIGDVIQWTGWATTGTPNNNHNFLITALTATVMTGTNLDGVAVGAKAAGDSVTATVMGKKTLVPLTGHTNKYFTIEEYYPDLSPVVSERFADCKPNTIAVGLPATGNATIDIDWMGLNRTTAAAQNFTTPSTETLTEVFTAANAGFLLINGTQVINVTGVQFTIDGNIAQLGPVVGANVNPDLQRGRIKVSGQFTMLFSDMTTDALFDAGTYTSLVVILQENTTANCNIMGFNFSRIRVNADTPDDGEKGIVRTYTWTGEINDAGGAALASDQTIVSIQETLG